jgi:putative SOS response-associated peptidase YedK
VVPFGVICLRKNGETRARSCLTMMLRPIHAKAVPVLLTTGQEFDTWIDAPVKDAVALQRPLPNELLRIVAKGEKSDEAPS